MTEKEKRSLKIRLGQRLSYDKSRIMEIVKEEIDKTETTPERPHGKWIIIDDCEKFIARCSVCGRILDSRMVKDYPFCRCGADMREGGVKRNETYRGGV